MKKFFVIAMALMLNCISGATLGAAVGIEPIIGAAGMNLVAVAASFLPMEYSILRAGVYREIWTGEMVKKLRGGLEGTWLDGIPDMSALVDNDVIHLVDVGVDPDVLINNTTYPIPLQVLGDSDIPVGLDKFQTKVTPVTDDELHALSYDKMARVLESHGNAISDAKFAKAAHSICAASNTATTPVLSTSGEVVAETGRKRMTRQDLVNMKAALDKLGVPADGRRLVLCPDHVNDMLGWSEAFQHQYGLDNANGKVARLYGFDIYEFAATPLYTTAGAKKSYNAAAETGEFRCSFAFYTNRIFKATGSTKMYHSLAETDPEYQRNKVNFRHYFIAMPKKADAGVVMMSGYTATVPEG